MTKQEAVILLKFSPNTSDQSAVNLNLSQKVCVGIIRKAVEMASDTETLSAILTKRVFQMVQNRKHPAPVWHQPTE